MMPSRLVLVMIRYEAAPVMILSWVTPVMTISAVEQALLTMVTEDQT
jgi:hypothetical protein